MTGVVGGLLLLCLTSMAWAQVDIAALRAEIGADPNGYGYAALVGKQNWGGIADALNTVRAGITLARTTIDAAGLQQAVVASEYLTRLEAQRDLWQAILLMATSAPITIKDANIQAQLSAVWAGTTTLAAIVKLQTRTATRAEQLFGIGTAVSVRDVAEAMR